MSAPIEKLRQTAAISKREHLAIFDHYIALGKDIETLAIKFGYDIPVICTILEGYGENLRDGAGGRMKHVPQVLVREYIDHFYPGIASENPENDWINLEAYLDVYHSGWRQELSRNQKNEKSKWKSGRKLY